MMAAFREAAYGGRTVVQLPESRTVAHPASRRLPPRYRRVSKLSNKLTRHNGGSDVGLLLLALAACWCHWRPHPGLAAVCRRGYLVLMGPTCLNHRTRTDSEPRSAEFAPEPICARWVCVANINKFGPDTGTFGPIASIVWQPTGQVWYELDIDQAFDP